jgi:hypothetical protein
MHPLFLKYLTYFYLVAESLFPESIEYVAGVSFQHPGDIVQAHILPQVMQRHA